MVTIQFFLWIFMIIGFSGVYSENRGKVWSFFIWLVSLLLIIATKVFL